MLISLIIAIVAGLVAWRTRANFSAKPYLFWFAYFPLVAVGLHQFEEYGFPGHFREAFVAALGAGWADPIVPAEGTLALLSAVALLPLFGLTGLLGTRIIWLGLAVLFVNFGNGFFHLIESVIHMRYVPGAVTGTLLYLPLALLAAHFAVNRREVSAAALLGAFFLGTAASLMPFLHVWLLQWQG